MLLKTGRIINFKEMNQKKASTFHCLSTPKKNFYSKRWQNINVQHEGIQD